MRIGCVGGGPAGLYFAILMKAREPEHDIVVFERNPAGTTYGWGVVFWDDLLDELHASDPVTARTVAAEAFRWNGETLRLGGRDPVHEPGRGYGIGRQRLLELLLTRARGLGVQVHFEHEVYDLAELGDQDLVVACDGAGSCVRERLREQFRPTVHVGRNKYIWLGTNKTFDEFTFAFVRTAAGWIWCHAYGFDGETSTFIVECSPETWRGLGFDRIGADASLRRLEELFRSHLDGHPLRCKTRTNGAAPWLNFRTLTNESWHHGNVVLVGDAAHTTHFTIGSGTKLALEDAISLAAHVHDEPRLATALDAYEQERRAAMRPTQTDARFSAEWFENVGRYAGLEPTRFFALLHERRSPLLPRTPPRLYYRLHQATHEIGPLRRLRKWAAPRIKLLHGR